MMRDRYRPLFALALVAGFAFAAPTTVWAQAGAVSKGMQTYCVNDYKKFCGEWGLEARGLNLCMRKAGPSLSPACVQALVKAGKISQGEVDKIKAKAGRP
ncbi:MAG: hypothetical protein V3S93_02215 [Methyloceanibacter sp.]